MFSIVILYEAKLSVVTIIFIRLVIMTLTN